MIKRFKSYLSENYLDSYQKTGFLDYISGRGFKIDDLDTPSKKALNLSKHIMPEGTDSIEIPIMSSTMASIHNHLKQHGYTMDYGKKEAYKDTINNRGENQRQTTSIGKALNKTKAPPSLISSFASDNHQEAAELSSRYKVIISRKPHDIAACSTNAPWSSCATLNSNGEPSEFHSGEWGDNPNEFGGWGGEKTNPHLAAAHLPYDIKHGTHVAYMVPNIDAPHSELIRNAKARLLLKPFAADDGHTVLKSETKGYIEGHKDGVQVPQGFKDTIKSFTDTNFPMKDNTIYEKNNDLYNDDNVKETANLNINKEFPHWISLSGGAKSKFIKNSNISTEDIENTINKVKNNEDIPIPDIINHLHAAKNFTQSHYRSLVDPNILSKLDINAHNNLISGTKNQEDFDKLVDYHANSKITNWNDYPSSNSVENIINHPLAKPKHIQQIIDGEMFNKSNLAKQVLLPDMNLSGNSLDKMVNKLSDDPSYDHVLQNPNLESHHIKSIISNMETNKYREFNTNAFIENNSSKFDGEDLHNLLDMKGRSFKGQPYIGYNNEFTIKKLISSPNFNISHLRKLHSILPNKSDFSFSMNSMLLDKNNKDINEQLFDHNLATDNASGALSSILNKHHLHQQKISRLLYGSRINIDSDIIHGLIGQKNIQPEQLANIIHPKKLNELTFWERSGIVNKLMQHPDNVDKFISVIKSSDEPLEKMLVRTNNNRKDYAKFLEPEVYNKLHNDDKQLLGK